MNKRISTKKRLPPLEVFLLLLIGGVLFFSCSSAPKNVEPERPTSAEAAKYADLGNSFFNESRFGEAAEMYELALQRYLRIDDQAGAVSAYNSLAKTKLASGDPGWAEKMLQAAGQILDTYPLESEEFRKSRAETFNNLGELHYALGKYEQALDCFERGLNLVSAESDVGAYAILLHNRGTALFSLGRIDQGESSILEALEINRKEKNLYETASNHFMLALAAVERGDTAAAEDHATMALALDKEVENSRGIAHDLFLLGRIAHAAGQQEKSLGYLDRAEQIFLSLELEHSRSRVAEYRQKVVKN
jgi:tetratricopeptide (TPR) repeat protein